MNMMTLVGDHGDFRRQAKVARELGSPFVAQVLEAGHRQLRHAPLTAEVIASWPRDASASALAMRFNAAMHALARRNAPTALTGLYQRRHDDYDGAISEALAAEDRFVSAWMRETPQTNEVGRAAAFAAALMVARRQWDLPFELLELGSSCGLNLNLARYAYDLGGVSAGAADSPVRIAPIWRGSPPFRARIDVVAARGVDLNPLNAEEEATRERLLSYVWADQPARAERLEQALELARRHRPEIDRGDAVSWLTRQLEAAARAGVCRVVLHSMVFQYLSAEDRRTIIALIQRAGDGATRDRPLAWISFEWTEARSEVQLSLTCWPDGGTRILGKCHAYGNWIEWHE